jgi:ATP-dependent Clp protease ATP-binding subunit ClpB
VQDPLAELILSGQVKDGDNVPVTAGPEGLLIGDVVVAHDAPPKGALLN